MSGSLEWREKELSREDMKKEAWKCRKRVCGFYIFPVLYVISVYLVPVLFLLTGGTMNSCFLYLPVLAGVLNAAACMVSCRQRERGIMLRAAVIVKVSLLFFFVFGGMLVMLALSASLIPVPFMIVLGPVLSFAGAAGGWIVLALESPYVIAYLYLACREGMMSKRTAVFHTVLQFFFVADVADIIFLGLTERRRRISL